MEQGNEGTGTQVSEQKTEEQAPVAAKQEKINYAEAYSSDPDARKFFDKLVSKSVVEYQKNQQKKGNDFEQLAKTLEQELAEKDNLLKEFQAQQEKAQRREKVVSLASKYGFADIADDFMGDFSTPESVEVLMKKVKKLTDASIEADRKERLKTSSIPNTGSAGGAAPVGFQFMDARSKI